MKAATVAAFSIISSWDIEPKRFYCTESFKFAAEWIA